MKTLILVFILNLHLQFSHTLPKNDLNMILMTDADAMDEDVLVKGRLTILQLLLDESFRNMADIFLTSLTMITEDESSAQIMISPFKQLLQLLRRENTSASLQEIVDGLRLLLTNKQASETLAAILESIKNVMTDPHFIGVINGKFDLAIMFANGYRGTETISAMADGLVRVLKSKDPKNAYIKAFTNVKDMLSTSISSKLKKFFSG